MMDSECHVRPGGSGRRAWISSRLAPAQLPEPTPREMQVLIAASPRPSRTHCSPISAHPAARNPGWDDALISDARRTDRPIAAAQVPENPHPVTRPDEVPPIAPLNGPARPSLPPVPLCGGGRRGVNASHRPLPPRPALWAMPPRSLWGRQLGSRPWLSSGIGEPGRAAARLLLCTRSTFCLTSLGDGPPLPITPELGWLRPVRAEPIPWARQVYPQEKDLGTRL